MTPVAAVHEHAPACRLNLAFFFGLMLISGVCTAISPVLGAAVTASVFLVLFFHTRPFWGFVLAYGLALIQNLNLTYDSAIRIVAERYSLSLIPAIVMLGLWFAGSAGNLGFKPRLFGKPVPALLAFVVVWAGCTYLWTQDPGHGVNMMFNLTTGLVIFFLIQVHVRNPDELEALFKALVVFGFLLAVVLCISNKIETNGGLSWQLGRRLSIDCNLIRYSNRPGGFAPPQLAGTTLSFIFFAGLGLFPKVGRMAKAGLIFLGLFFISDILATGSKGAAGAFMLAMLFFLLVYPRIRGWFFITIPAFVGTVLFIMVFNIIFFRADRLAASATQQSLSLTYRLTFWEAGLQMLQERWIGAGVGGFARLVDPWPGAHSTYFSVLFDLGFVGFVVFFGACLLLLQRVIRLLGKTSGTLHRYLFCMLCVLIVCMIHGTVDISFDLPFVWLVLGTVAAVIRIADPSQPGQPQAPHRTASISAPLTSGLSR